MKHKIKNVIDNVILHRLNLGGREDLTIQLSSILMKKFIEEMNDLAGTDKYICGSGLSEVLYNKYDKTWCILNREFRDDTNDFDVEEEIYKSL